MQMAKVKTGKIKHLDIFKTIAGLCVLGNNYYADVAPSHDDVLFRDCSARYSRSFHCRG
jgi:hypothetical protein